MTVLVHAPRACMVCGKVAVLEVTAGEAAALATERFIQDALPTRSPAEREMLISGTHPACWDSIFADEEE